jgi:uncharacterized protein
MDLPRWSTIFCLSMGAIEDLCFMKIPSKNDCFRLMCKMNMLEHIVAHSLQVGRVAICLADHLEFKGIHLNDQLIKAASLLHDITKTRSFETEENHALTGGQLVADLGYPEVGNLIRQHVRLDEYCLQQIPREAEIINYADKRVLHDRLVTLEERMNYIFKKYGRKPEHQQRIRLMWERTEGLEKKLFSYLSFSPENLRQHLKPWDISDEITRYRRVCLKLTSGRS